MKIVVIDERQGDVLRQDAKNHSNNCDLRLTIEADGHVKVVSNTSYDIDVHFFQAVHRDVISAEKSRKADERREEEKVKNDVASEDAMTKGTRVWDKEWRGNSGTERITGAT